MFLYITGYITHIKDQVPRGLTIAALRFRRRFLANWGVSLIQETCQSRKLVKSRGSTWQHWCLGFRCSFSFTIETLSVALRCRARVHRFISSPAHHPRNAFCSTCDWTRTTAQDRKTQCFRFVQSGMQDIYRIQIHSQDAKGKQVRQSTCVLLRSCWILIWILIWVFLVSQLRFSAMHGTAKYSCKYLIEYSLLNCLLSAGFVYGKPIWSSYPQRCGSRSSWY